MTMTPTLQTRPPKAAGAEREDCRRKAPAALGRRFCSAWRACSARRRARRRRLALPAASSSDVMATTKQRRALRAEGPHGCASRQVRARRVITLPATTSAFTTANIFARASGYIEKRNVDIGDQGEGRRASRRDHRARARPSDRAGAGHARADRGDARSRTRRTWSWRASPGSATSLWSRRAGSTVQQGDDRHQDPAGTAGRGRRGAIERHRAAGADRACCSSRRPIRAWSRRSTASSRSAISTSAAWCRRMPRPAPSCSP